MFEFKPRNIHLVTMNALFSHSFPYLFSAMSCIKSKICSLIHWIRFVIHFEVQENAIKLRNYNVTHMLGELYSLIFY